MSKNSQGYKTPDEKTQELLKDIEDNLSQNKGNTTWDGLAETWRSSQNNHDERKAKSV